MSVAALTLVLLGAAALPAQESAQPPVFRSGVQIVELDVRVFDEQARFIDDLGRGDFEVLEDGVPQQLQTAYLVEDVFVPSAAVPTRSRAADSTAAAGSVPVSRGRQTWIFVFDLNHLTPGAGFDRARQAVETFFRERFTDDDLAGVVAGSRMVNNRLTSVREELVSAVRSVKPLSDLRSLQLEMTREWPRLLDESEVMQIAREQRDAVDRAVTRACTEDPGACTRAPPDLEVREKARRLHRTIQQKTMETLTALNALASGLATIPGPKAIVFLSDGFVVEEMDTALRSVVGQTARSGGRVYAIDMRGLNRGRGAGIIDQPVVVDEVGAFSQFDGREDGPASLAVDTGGMLIRNENNIGRALETIAADANRYYVLGYQPLNEKWNGAFRSVAVRVKRERVKVRARSGYLALEPARMLVPQPVKAATPGRADRVAPSAGEAAATHEGAPTIVPEVAPSPAVVTGTTTGAAPAGVAAGLRLGPETVARVRGLAAGETATSGASALEGWEAYQRGDLESAIGPLTAAAADPNVRPWVLYTLGLTQAGLARPRDAVEMWERVRQAAPDYEPVYGDLADTYGQLAELTRALAVLRDAEARWPANPDFRNAIGVIHVRRGALDDAIEAFSRAVAAAPREALAYLNVARAYQLRYARGGRYVTSQRQWVVPEGDRRKAAENYQKYIDIGGPYVAQAAAALSLLEWGKK